MKFKSFSLLLILLAAASFSGCSRRTSVEVIDLNKVLDIYDKVIKSKEDPSKTEADKPADGTEENTEDINSFLKLFATELNNAKLIKSPIGVDMLPSGIVRGFVDRDKNNTKASSEAELFTIEFDKEANRIIATQKVAGRQYRRDHHYGSGYYRYYFYHRMYSSMRYRQNRYYTGSRQRPNYSGFTMSSPSYHSQAVSHARTTARASSRSRSTSRSSSRSSARGFGRSGSFSFGK